MVEMESVDVVVWKRVSQSQKNKKNIFVKKQTSKSHLPRLGIKSVDSDVCLFTADSDTPCSTNY